MGEKCILEVFVELTSGAVTEVAGRHQRVTMIPFTGTARGEIFNGVVAPGGTDTQVTDCCGVRRMSARYTLVGTDRAGRPCRIYVQNEGAFMEGEDPSPFRTVPTFITDSEALADYLHRAAFRGEGHPGEKGPIIRFFELE